VIASQIRTSDRVGIQNGGVGLIPTWLYMTIELGVWVFPTVINISLLILCIISAINDSGWFAGVFQILLGIIGTLFIWLTFFSVMYFCK